MYFMYVDESGDPGCASEGNSAHYILSGIIISEHDWKDSLQRMVDFRKAVKEHFGLNPKIELHCAELIRVGKIDEYKAIRKSDRIRLIKYFMSQIPLIFSKAKIINICFKKAEHPHYNDFQKLAWQRLIQRYDTFLKKSENSKGVIISDDGGESILRSLLRKMRVYNPVASHFTSYYNPVIDNIIEDIFHRDSKHSHFVQVVDFIAHCLYRKEFPKGSLKKFGVDLAFQEIEPLLLKQASGSDPLGIVRK